MNQPPKSIDYGMKAVWAARCCLVLCLLPAYAEVGLVVGGVALAAYSGAHGIGLVRRREWTSLPVVCNTGSQTCSHGRAVPR